MSEFLGQDKLLAKINNFTFDTLPKTILFIGPFGCGKRTLARYIANKFNLVIKELDNTVDTDQLVAIQQTVVQTLCIINLDNFFDKQQNQFLKFIEEPGQTIHIILTTSSELRVIPTILNRCIKYYFADYSVDFLKNNFSDKVSHENELVYTVCKTPGQLLNVDGNTIKDLFNCCTKLLANITTIGYPNLLKVSTLINYKDDYDRFDFEQFLSVLKQAAFEQYKIKRDELSFSLYKIINDKIKLYYTLPLVQENFIIDCLTTLWEAAR